MHTVHTSHLFQDALSVEQEQRTKRHGFAKPTTSTNDKELFTSPKKRRACLRLARITCRRKAMACIHRQQKVLRGYAAKKTECVHRPGNHLQLTGRGQGYTTAHFEKCKYTCTESQNMMLHVQHCISLSQSAPSSFTIATRNGRTKLLSKFVCVCVEKSSSYRSWLRRCGQQGPARGPPRHTETHTPHAPPVDS